jgi:hypothetical protein
VNRREFLKSGLAGVIGAFLTGASAVKAEQTEPVITGYVFADYGSGTSFHFEEPLDVGLGHRSILIPDNHVIFTEAEPEKMEPPVIYLVPGRGAILTDGSFGTLAQALDELDRTSTRRE